MASKHTIIFVPHARAKFRKFRISTGQIGLATAAVIALTLASTALTWAFFTQTVSAEDVNALRQENDSLRDINASFETSIHELQVKLAQYEERTRKLAIVAGVESLGSPSEVGIGGSVPLNPSPGLELQELSQRFDNLGSDLQTVEHELLAMDDRIASMPSISPTSGLFTSGFGIRRDPITGRPASHQGIDISAPAGTPIRATADGIVTKSGWSGNLGKAVYISHGYGLTTRYGHMSRVAVAEGQRVKRGEVVGFVGSTGRSTGYHLHYEVRDADKAVNPRAYILDR